MTTASLLLGETKHHVSYQAQQYRQSCSRLDASVSSQSDVDLVKAMGIKTAVLSLIDNVRMSVDDLVALKDKLNASNIGGAVWSLTEFAISECIKGVAVCAEIASVRVALLTRERSDSSLHVQSFVYDSPIH